MNTQTETSAHNQLFTTTTETTTPPSWSPPQRYVLCFTLEDPNYRKADTGIAIEFLSTLNVCSLLRLISILRTKMELENYVIREIELVKYEDWKKFKRKKQCVYSMIK